MSAPPKRDEGRRRRSRPYWTAGIVVGTVVAWHIREDVMLGDRIDTERLRPLGRLAGPRYTKLGEVTELPPVPGG